MMRVKSKAFIIALVLCLVLVTCGEAAAAITDTSGHWAQGVIGKWTANSWAAGYPDGTFQPDKEISRAELVVLVNKAFQIPQGDIQLNLSDIQSSDWFYQSIRSAKQAGYITGYPDGTFKPDSPVSRQEMAVILAKLLNLSTDDQSASARFNDNTSFPDWSKGSISAVVKSNIMTGYPEGTFQPAKFLTRAEALLALDNALKLYSTEEEVVLKTGPAVESPTPTTTTGGGSSGGGGSSAEGAPPVLKWVNAPGEGAIQYQGQAIYLEVEVYDADNDVKEIKWEAAEGTLSSRTGTTTTWTLPETNGTKLVKAMALDKKSNQSTIQLNVNIVSFTDELMGNTLMTLSEYGDNEDPDSDDLTCLQEGILGTDDLIADTDSDGLKDGLEINTTHTDPLKRDTDGDGLGDGVEGYLGLDPLSPDSDNDGIPDSNETVERTFGDASVGGSATIKGSPEIAEHTFISQYSNPFIKNYYGVVGDPIDIYCSDSFEQAALTMYYTDEELAAKGLDEDALTIFWFNEKEKKLKPLASTIDKVNNIVTAQVSHFSKYLVGDSSKITQDISKTDIVFVLDNSGSMSWNDPADKRVDAAKSIISSLNGDYRFSIVEFSSTAATLQSLTDDKSSVLDAADSIRGTAGGGTAIGYAIQHAVGEFDDDNSRKVIFFLTDGEDYDTEAIDAAVGLAASKHIQIYSIGLGDAVNGDLLESNIAAPTGGQYYFVDDIDSLTGAFGSIGGNIALTVDVPTGDGKTITGIPIADCGFTPGNNGFRFGNLSTTFSDGLCQGFAVVPELYFNKELPLSEAGNSSQYQPAYNLSGTPHFKNRLDLYGFSEPNLEYLDLICGSGYWNYVTQDPKGNYFFKEPFRTKMADFGCTFVSRPFSDDKNHYYEWPKLNTASQEYLTGPSWTSEQRELFNCIQWWFGEQLSTDYKFDHKMVFDLDYVISELKKGRSVVVTFSGKNKEKKHVGHAVVAEKVLQDPNDSSKYWLIIYDNNYPDTDRWIAVTKKRGWTSIMPMAIPIIPYDYYVCSPDNTFYSEFAKAFYVEDPVNVIP